MCLTSSALKPRALAEMLALQVHAVWPLVSDLTALSFPFAFEWN